jgi:predicted GH43/DUF377 family glycosyl hydrolase
MIQIQRWHKNPIIAPSPDCAWRSRHTFNPGAVFDGQKVRMLFTGGGTDPARELCLGYAESTDGFHFEQSAEPFFTPSEIDGEFDHGTVDDARITELEGDYYIAYAARAMPQNRWHAGERPKNAPNNNATWIHNLRRVGLARTRDWKTVERLGPLTSEHLCDANVVLFPERINGDFVILHRPTPTLPWYIYNKYCPGTMWIAFSKDLGNWGWEGIQPTSQPWSIGESDHSRDYLLIRPEYDWEAQKIGASGVPIATDEGWLMLYHGVDVHGVYRIGALLLDRNNPRRVIARTRHPVMVPDYEYETNTGLYPNCIFPCANVVIGDEIFVYYGAADLACCVATIKLKTLLDHVLSERTV